MCSIQSLRAEIKTLHDQKQSLRAIARSVQRSPGTVFKHLKVIRLEADAAAKAQKPKQKRYDPLAKLSLDTRQQVIETYRRTRSKEMSARFFGVSIKVIDLLIKHEQQQEQARLKQLRETIKQLIEEGKTLKEIMQSVSLSKESVRAYLRELNLRPAPENLTGKTYGYWLVKQPLDEGKWLVVCQECEQSTRQLQKSTLVLKQTTLRPCPACLERDHTLKVWGSWKVLARSRTFTPLHRSWDCLCLECQKTIKPILIGSLERESLTALPCKECQVKAQKTQKGTNRPEREQ